MEIKVTQTTKESAKQYLQAIVSGMAPEMRKDGLWGALHVKKTDDTVFHYTCTYVDDDRSLVFLIPSDLDSTIIQLTQILETLKEAKEFQEKEKERVVSV